MKTIYLTLWIHGTAGDIDTPCGEVDVVEFSGDNIRIEFIEWVLLDKNNILECLTDIPIEKWVKVKIKPSCEENDWWFDVIDFHVMPITN